MEQLTQSQFISKSIVLIIFGIVYVAILVYCARRDPSLLPQKKKYKTLRTILGILSLVLCGLSFVLIVIQLSSDRLIDNSFTEMGYNLGRFGTTSPTETMKETGIGAYPIFRNSNASIVWGYPSQAQFSFLSTLLYFFVFLGLGLYLLLFKPSDTSKGKKALKVIGFILLWFTYSGILSLHYFDSIELIPIIIIIGLAFLCLFVFARDKHIETEMNNYENNLSGDKIQQEIKPKEGSNKKHHTSLFIWGFIISIPLITIAISCYKINVNDNHKIWQYKNESKWSKNVVNNDSLLGLPLVKSYYFNGFDQNNIGVCKYYSIPNENKLSNLRIWLTEHSSNNELVPFLNSQGSTDYYSLQKHPILKEEEVYFRPINKDGLCTTGMYIIKENLLILLYSGSHDQESSEQCFSHLLSSLPNDLIIESDYPSMRISNETVYFMTGFCFVFWMVFAIVYYSRRMKNLRLSNDLLNKSAIRLSRHVLWCTILWFIVGGIGLLWVYNNEDNGFWGYIGIMVIGIIAFIINMFILRYTINKINQEPSEDYLIPNWFKLQNANVLKNMGIVRLFLLFIIWPIFVLIPVPLLGAFAIMYSVGVLLLYYLVFYGIKGISWITTWIISGTKTKISYKEKE